MRVEAKLKRTPSKEHPARTNTRFPSLWNLQCCAYSTLKLHILDAETRKKAQQGTNDEKRGFDWEEQVLSTMLAAEINKISSFYEDRHNECVEGLKSISSEIPNVCTIRSAGNTHVWHEFTIHYCNKAKTIETCQETPAQFTATLEEYLLSLAGKPIERAMLIIFKKFVEVHKLSLHLKAFAQYNIAEIKKLLRKHDEKSTTSISTEWMERIRRESFGTYDCFEKIIALTKDVIHSLIPSSDDFACPICLGLLCEPVVIQCGHRFCEHCLIAASASCSFCPMCRAEQQLHPSNHTLDKPLKQYLKQFFPNEYKASLREHKNSKRKTSNCTIS